MDNASRKRKDKFRKYEAFLREWQDMDSWETIVDREVLFTRDFPGEVIEIRAKEYFDEVETRIRFCEGLLSEYYDESILYYTLAELYDRCDPDSSLENLYKRRVRYFCKKALQINPDHSRSWALMADSYSWVALIFGVKDLKDSIMVHISKNSDVYKSSACVDHEISKKQRLVIKRVERAIYCIKRAIRIKPRNVCYGNQLRKFYEMRNQEYSSASQARDIY